MVDLVIEYDDFHWQSPENCLKQVYYLVQKFPTIKITFFTSPFYQYRALSENKDWCQRVRELIGSNNIRLAVHGTTHNTLEYKNMDIRQVAMSIQDSHNFFESAQLPFIRVFRGPHWGINENVYKVLREYQGYTHIYTHEDYKHLIKPEQTIKSIIYNWNLKDKEPDPNLQTIIAHGHTHNVCSNGIEETLPQLEQYLLTHEVNFKFANEV
jgi:hypothetical protein